jgi:hypothetical protein
MRISSATALKVTLNHSSFDYIIDYYDFEPQPTTSSASAAVEKNYNYLFTFHFESSHRFYHENQFSCDIKNNHYLFTL